MVEMTTDKEKIKKGFINAIDNGKIDELEEYLMFYPKLLNARFYSEGKDTPFNAMMRAAEKGKEEVIDFLQEQEISPRYDTEAYLLAVKNGHRSCADKIDENGTVRVTSLHIQEMIENNDSSLLADILKRRSDRNIISGTNAHGMGLTLTYLNNFLVEREAETGFILSYMIRKGHGKMLPELEEKGVNIKETLLYMAGTAQVENLKLIYKYSTDNMKKIYQEEKLIDFATYYRAIEEKDQKTIDQLLKTGSKEVQKVIRRDRAEQEQLKKRLQQRER